MHLPFTYRLAAGLLLLALLLALDLRRGRTQRLKEYAFLFGVAVAAMGYGVAHDYVSWSICRDYFVAGKGILSAASRYSWETMKHAMGVGWTVGLVGAAVLLVANNRDRLGRQLPYVSLMRLAILVLLGSMAAEMTLGTIFRLTAAQIASAAGLDYILDSTGPSFFTVWGMHIGTYLGGAIGVVIAAVVILRKKRGLSSIVSTPEMPDAIGHE